MPQEKTQARREAARLKKQQKKLRRRRILLVFAALILVGLLSWGAVEIAKRVLLIEHVELAGKSRYTAEELLDTAAVETKKNILLYKTGPIKERLLQTYPYIGEVTVHKKLPDTVVIEITQQEPVAVLELDGRYLYISEDEKILEIAAAPLQGVPCFTGFKLYGVQAGEPLELESETTRQVYRTLCEQMYTQNTEKIDVIDVRDIHNIGLLYDKRVYMRLGTATDLAFKIRFGLKIMDGEDGSGLGPEEHGTLDLTLAPENNKAYFTES